MKRIVFFVVAMVAIVMHSGAYTLNDVFSSGDIYYAKLTDTTAMVIANPYDNGKGYGGDITIPYDAKGYKVVAINDSAFVACTKISSLNIKGITDIGNYAFARCSWMETATMPYTKKIGKNAFAQCGFLKEIELLSATDVGGYAFALCDYLVTAKLPKAETLGYCVFYYCKKLETIEIPNVDTIDSYTFSGCKNLTSVEATNATYIGSWAFENCDKLEILNLPNVRQIDEFGFENCIGLKEIVMPQVEYIGNNAFQGCTSLSSIELPSNLDTIEFYAFKGCSSLERVKLKSMIPPFLRRNSLYDPFEGASPNLVIQVPRGSLEDYKKAWGDRYKYEEYLLTLEHKGLTYAYLSNSRLEVIGKLDGSKYSGDIEIPKGINVLEKGKRKYKYVERIADKAFDGSSDLTSVKLSSIVTSIGRMAFCNCFALKTIEMPSVVSVEDSAFMNCAALTTIVLPNVDSIGDYAFGKCSGLKTLDIPLATVVGNNVFNSCVGLSKVALPNVKKMGDGVFESCMWLATVEMPNVTTINKKTFRNCTNLATFDMSNLLTIKEQAFEYCAALKNLDLQKVTTIEKRAFAGCSNLGTVELSSRLKTIGEEAFESCGKLVLMRAKSLVPPTLGENALLYTSQDMVIYVPVGTKSKYQAAWGDGYTYRELAYTFEEDGVWYSQVSSQAVEVVANPNGGYYSGDITITNRCKYGDLSFTIVAIGDKAFYGCDKLTSIKLKGNSIRTIGEEAFSGCTALTSLELVTMTTIGKKAFYGCTSIKEADLLDATTIGDYAFANAEKLERIWMPDAKTIGDAAFANCEALATVDMPDVKIIGAGAFEGCKALRTFDYDVTSLGERAFAEAGLTSVYIAPLLHSIGELAFAGNTNLSSIEVHDNNVMYASKDSVLYTYNFETLIQYSTVNEARVFVAPDSVKSVSKEAFRGSLNLETVHLPNVHTIEAEAFAGCAALTTVDMPQVRHIGDAAFMASSELKRLRVMSMEPPTLGEDVFDAASSNIVVEVPCGASSDYRAAEGWGNFSYEEEFYRLVVSVNDEKMGRVDMESEPTCENPTTEMEAVANEGYEFERWSDGLMENPRTVSLKGTTKDVYITAIFKSKGTSVENVGFEELNVYTNGLSLYVEGAKEAYEVYTTTGTLVYAGGATPIALPRGIYIIRYKGAAMKIVL